MPIIYTRHAAGLVRQHRSDGAPLIVRKFAAHDPSLQIGGLNHDPPSTCTEATATIGMSAFEAEPEIFCSIRALPVVPKQTFPPIAAPQKSAGEAVAEHRQPADGLGLCRLVLKHVP